MSQATEKLAQGLRSLEPGELRMKIVGRIAQLDPQPQQPDARHNAQPRVEEVPGWVVGLACCWRGRLTDVSDRLGDSNAISQANTSQGPVTSLQNGLVPLAWTGLLSGTAHRPARRGRRPSQDP